MDTLAELDLTVGQFLVAGAALAPQDPGLAARRTELEALSRELGERVPAIPQLTAAVGAVIAAKGTALSAIAAELLALAAGSSRVRAAQARLARVEGPLLPFHATRPLGNTCRAQLLYEIHDALNVHRGSWYSAGWKEVRHAVDRETVADVRLVSSIAGALCEECLAEEEAKLLVEGAAPLLGPALAPELRARFSKAGVHAAARLLRVLATIVKDSPGEQDRALLLSALERNEPAIREAAFDAIGQLFPNDKAFESFVLAALTPPTDAVLRCAGTFAHNEALEACLAALDGSSRDAAAAGLARSRHPLVVERLLARLGDCVARRASDSVRAVLRALAPHQSPKLAPRAVPLIDAYGIDAAKVVLAGEDTAALAALATRLSGKDETLFDAAARAASKLGRDEAWRFLSAAFRAKDRPTPLGLARISAVLGALGRNADKRWHNLLLDEMRLDPERLAARVLVALGRMQDREGAAIVLGEVGTRSTLRADLLDALAAIGDPAHFERALDLLVDAPGISVPGARVIRVLARKETLPKLRAFVMRNASYRGLLGDMERRFTST